MNTGQLSDFYTIMSLRGLRNCQLTVLGSVSQLNGGSTNAFVEAKTTLARVCKVTLTVQSLGGRDLL